MLADNEEGFTHTHNTYNFNSSFPPPLCCQLPPHPTAEPNQSSTTGKNLIMVHPDTTTMDDAFFLLCLFYF